MDTKVVSTACSDLSSKRKALVLSQIETLLYLNKEVLIHDGRFILLNKSSRLNGLCLQGDTLSNKVLGDFVDFLNDYITMHRGSML